MRDHGYRDINTYTLAQAMEQMNLTYTQDTRDPNCVVFMVKYHGVHHKVICENLGKDAQGRMRVKIITAYNPRT